MKSGPITDLKDTAEMMASEDYRERFRAEYWQTKIRYEKLKNLTTRIEAVSDWGYIGNIEEPKHDCPKDLLNEQQAVMENYLHLMEVRAVIENIEL